MRKISTWQRLDVNWKAFCKKLKAQIAGAFGKLCSDNKLSKKSKTKNNTVYNIHNII